MRITKVINWYQHISIFLVFILFISCGRELNYLEYTEWWNENKEDFVYNKNIGNSRFTLILLPSLKEQTKYIRFEFRIADVEGKNFLYHDVHNDEELTRRLSYFQTAFKETCMLINGESEISCTDVILQPTTGVTPYVSFILVFDNKLNYKKETKLEFRDDILQNGIVRMKVKNLDIIPTIKRI